MEGIPPLNSASNLHWRRKKTLKDLWTTKVKHALVGKRRPAEPVQTARVVILIGNSIAPDYDALVYGGKYLLDILNKDHERIIHDDGPKYIGKSDYHWTKTKRVETFTKVSVRECEPEHLDMTPWEYEPELFDG